MKKGKKVCWNVDGNGKKITDGHVVSGNTRQPPKKTGSIRYPIHVPGVHLTEDEEEESEAGRFMILDSLLSHRPSCFAFWGIRCSHDLTLFNAMNSIRFITKILNIISF